MDGYATAPAPFRGGRRFVIGLEKDENDDGCWIVSSGGRAVQRLGHAAASLFLSA